MCLAQGPQRSDADVCMWCVLLLVSDDGGIDVNRSFVAPVLNGSERVCMLCISLSMVSVHPDGVFFVVRLQMPAEAVIEVCCGIKQFCCMQGSRKFCQRGSNSDRFCFS